VAKTLTAHGSGQDVDGFGELLEDAVTVAIAVDVIICVVGFGKLALISAGSDAVTTTIVAVF